jgi:aspartyl-tRNA(Asn)/glutamyl-tRNA(Gln) amidotransferase subunit C
MISKEEVKHIAKLARLGLTEKEIEKYQKELSSILDYIEKLKEVDVLKIEPTSHPLEVKNVMREDKKSEGREVKSEKFLDLAPETKEGYIKVKSILR